ncbi:MAG: hypothetical protein EOO88_08380 [Pedobacter sp.]|nr:MAG: hypothetical protein EOO88_08380 [Pedobacter sp.]
MGILPYGPFDGFYNKVGNLVGKRDKGRFLLSGRPRLTDATSTPELLSAQTKFLMLSSFLNKISAVVILGFKKRAKKMRPVHAAYRYNYSHAFISGENMVALDYSKIIYSKGDLLKPCGATAVLEPDASGIVFSWLSTPESLYNQDTDLASFMIYDSKNDVVYKELNVVKRADLGYNLKLRLRADAELECYMHFTAADGKLRSDSQHIAKLIASSGA